MGQPIRLVGDRRVLSLSNAHCICKSLHSLQKVPDTRRCLAQLTSIPAATCDAQSRGKSVGLMIEARLGPNVCTPYPAEVEGSETMTGNETSIPVYHWLLSRGKRQPRGRKRAADTGISRAAASARGCRRRRRCSTGPQAAKTRAVQAFHGKAGSSNVKFHVWRDAMHQWLSLPHASSEEAASPFLQAKSKEERALQALSRHCKRVPPSRPQHLYGHPPTERTL
ncbi:hypothetical protein F5144DRAFT_182403 [Chaetomium tenue]|uniref:Uncharacterized protein n=1 Tax=Chaetomium tenue TaxID=1854479 RepID=A0ACB7PBQ1_9PEZI|nr:hypothetical protein F5144DRAFT_182403 [Chaetomium globosum]